MCDDIDVLITKAKWAESAERYDDMADFMKEVITYYGKILKYIYCNLL